MSISRMHFILDRFLPFTIKAPSDFLRRVTLIVRMSPVRSLMLHMAVPSVTLRTEPLNLMITCSNSLTLPETDVHEVWLN